MSIKNKGCNMSTKRLLILFLILCNFSINASSEKLVLPAPYEAITKSINGAIYQIIIPTKYHEDGNQQNIMPELKFYKDKNLKGEVYAEIKDYELLIEGDMVCSVLYRDSGYQHFVNEPRKKKHPQANPNACEKSEFRPSWKFANAQARILALDIKDNVVKTYLNKQVVYFDLKKVKYSRIIKPFLVDAKEKLSADHYNTVVDLFSFLTKLNYEDLENEKVDKLFCRSYKKNRFKDYYSHYEKKSKKGTVKLFKYLKEKLFNPVMNESYDISVEKNQDFVIGIDSSYSRDDFFNDIGWSRGEHIWPSILLKYQSKNKNLCIFKMRLK